MHTFVVCAYKESPYLEECICSLKNQTLKSKIIIETSTPNVHIEKIAKKYNVDVYINSGEGGITQDWNYGYAQANSKYITIAHQDDVYEPKFLENALEALEKAEKPLIHFTNYGEIRNGNRIDSNILLKIKRLMLLPLKYRVNSDKIFVRRKILSFGSPICCPSVTYVKENLPEKIFKNGFRSCEDWEAWEMISKLSGEFLYNKEILMYHRIHEESETSAIIGDNARSAEEYEMYCKFWPKWIAKIILFFYAKGQKSNNLD